MAKPKAADSSGIADAAGNALAPTPCETLGAKEIIVQEIVVRPGDQLEWRMTVCNTPGRAILRMMSSTGAKISLVDQVIPPPNPIRRSIMPPTPPAGQYVLYWGLEPSGPDWQTVAEVALNGTVVFRHFKGSKSAEPFSKGFLYVRVSS